jgi:hypothetical protein
MSRFDYGTSPIIMYEISSKNANSTPSHLTTKLSRLTVSLILNFVKLPGPKSGS